MESREQRDVDFTGNARETDPVDIVGILTIDEYIEVILLDNISNMDGGARLLEATPRHKEILSELKAMRPEERSTIYERAWNRKSADIVASDDAKAHAYSRAIEKIDSQIAGFNIEV